MKKEDFEYNPLWFKHAVIYQLHVRGFDDSNDDGIGDFRGLTKKLDYLESLGITAVWLLPFYPSPLKDEGYDISDYLDVNPRYGTLKDFKAFLHEAHKRNIRVIIELVVNHTSDQHPWFQRARQAKPGSAYRDFYIWNDNPNKFRQARIIFKDFETSNWALDPVAKAYYFHRFYSHQPDLNYDNPVVQKEVLRILDFWFEMGVDGLRLDAVPYLFKREGTNCENLPETHEFIKKMRKHVDEKFKDKVLIAEANQWPEDAAAYFGNADECHMAFHFPVMPRLFMALQMEDRFPIVDILEQTPILPVTCQWIMFLRNHDELTLEMVSDEERDYMYKIYAKDPKMRINLGIRRRLAPLLDNNRAKIELMNILLLSLPGTPAMYYGDEIGMGDNYYLGDRNGVRTPMQWNADRNAGFSKGNPQELYLPVVIDPSYHYVAVNVENQESNPSSLLWWVRRVLSIYKNYKAFGFGSFELIRTENSKVLAFIRIYENEIILVITNLSRFAESASLGLEKFAGYVPHELFHQNPFPAIKEEPYNITLGPYTYFWMNLTPSNSIMHHEASEEKSRLFVHKNWKHIFQDRLKSHMEKETIPKFLARMRWFERKSATVAHARIVTHISIGGSELCLLEVGYREIPLIDTYLLAISYAAKPEADQMMLDNPQSLISQILVDSQEGILYDSIYNEEFRNALFTMIRNKKRVRFDREEFVGYTSEFYKKTLSKNDQHPLTSKVFNAEQTNSCVVYGQEFMLKLYRKLEEGINPDIEIEKFLTEKTDFAHVPRFAGAMEWHDSTYVPMSIAILTEFVANEGTGWKMALDALSSYYEKVLAHKEADKEIAKYKETHLYDRLKALEPLLEELIGVGYLEAFRLLGQRTGEMHLALSSRPDDPEFAPELWGVLFQRSKYQAMRSKARTTIQILKSKLPNLPDEIKKLAEQVISVEGEILSTYHNVLHRMFHFYRIRTHGDYHLGQVLYTGKDFYVIDFEGEPLQTLSSRRVKRSALRDVAGMIRSFHYAAYKVLLSNTVIKPEGMPTLEPWAELWYLKMTKEFLQTYFQTVATAPLPIIPKEVKDCEFFLHIFMLEKALYELAYELNSRPDWSAIPCKGILFHLKNLIKLPEIPQK